MMNEVFITINIKRRKRNFFIRDPSTNLSYYINKLSKFFPVIVNNLQHCIVRIIMINDYHHLAERNFFKRAQYQQTVLLMYTIK